MKFFDALKGLLLVLGCVFSAIPEQQSLVFKHFGGKEGALTPRGKRLSLDVPNSALSTSAMVILAETGKAVKQFVCGNAIIAVARGGNVIDTWVSENVQASLELSIGDIVLVIIGSDAADMEDILGYVNDVFVDGKIQQNMVDDNEFFSISVYKVLDGNDPQPVKLFADEPNLDVIPVNLPHNNGSLALNYAGGWSGIAQTMIEPKLVHLTVADPEHGNTLNSVELKVGDAGSTASGIGNGMVYLFRDGEQFSTFHAKEKSVDWGVRAGDVVVFVVWNQRVKESEMVALISSALVDGNINEQVFGLGESHTIMAFKIEYKTMQIYPNLGILEDDAGSKEIPADNTFFHDKESFVLKLIGDDPGKEKLHMTLDYAILTLSDSGNNEHASTAKVVLKDHDSEFFVFGKALILLFRKGGLEFFFHPEESRHTIFDVEVDDIIQFITWKKDAEINEMVGLILDTINKGEIDGEIFEIVSFGVVAEEEQRNKKRKREEEEKFRPAKKPRFLNLVSLAEKFSSADFPAWDHFRVNSIGVTTRPDEEHFNFIGIDVDYRGRMIACISNNAYLFVVRDNEMIHTAFPGKYYTSIDFLERGDEIFIFIHKHELSSARIKISSSEDFVEAIKGLIEAGYSYASLDVRG